MDKSNVPVYIVIAVLVGLILYSLFGGEETFGETIARLQQTQPVNTIEEPIAAKENVDTEEQQPQKELERPILLYFYGVHCSACRHFEPEWNKIVNQYGDRYRCVKVNSDESKNARLCMEFNLRVIPTLYIVDTPYNVR